MSRLPKMAEKRVSDNLLILKSNIQVSDFPPEFRDGLYTAALEEIQSWENEEISLVDIYQNKKSPAMLANRLYFEDHQSFSKAKQIEKANKNAKKPLTSEEDSVDLE